MQRREKSLLSFMVGILILFYGITVATALTPPPRPRHAMLDKGISLYEQAKYSEASETLSSVIQELEDAEQRAEAYLYLGCSKWGAGEGNNRVRSCILKAQFAITQTKNYRRG